MLTREESSSARLELQLFPFLLGSVLIFWLPSLQTLSGDSTKSVPNSKRKTNIFGLHSVFCQTSVSHMQLEFFFTLFDNYSYGLPPTAKPPNGLNPLLEVWGKGKNRFPLLVLMNHPITWVVTLPSNDVNGEDGTIQAGEYAKGDTATFFVYQEPGHIDVGIFLIGNRRLLRFASLSKVFNLSLHRTLPALARTCMKSRLSSPSHKREIISTKISRSQRLSHKILKTTMARNMSFVTLNTLSWLVLDSKLTEEVLHLSLVKDLLWKSCGPPVHENGKWLMIAVPAASCQVLYSIVSPHVVCCTPHM